MFWRQSRNYALKPNILSRLTIILWRIAPVTVGSPHEFHGALAGQSTRFFHGHWVSAERLIELVFIEVQKLRYYIEEEFIVKKLAKKQNKTMKRLLKEERKNITLINDQILLNKHAFMIIESQNRFFENLGL